MDHTRPLVAGPLTGLLIVSLDLTDLILFCLCAEEGRVFISELLVDVDEVLDIVK